MSEVLNYGNLVRGYYENLHSTLRNFRPGPEFLESWVHDEDHNRSVLGIFESAYDAGVEALELYIEPEEAKDLDRYWLQEHLSPMGYVLLSDVLPGPGLRISLSKVTQNFEVAKPYHEALEEAAKRIGFHGIIDKREGTLCLEASFEGIVLTLLIDTDGNIVAASHRGASGVYLPLIDKFCELIIGLPIQEASDHGVIHLEYRLRDPEVEYQDKGIVIPENAEPTFLVPLKLIRDCYQKYLLTRQTDRGWNRWEPKVASYWKSLSSEGKVEKIRQALKNICEEKGLPYSDLPIIAIKQDTRIFFSGQAFSHHPSFGHDLMVLERELKKRLEPRIEVVLESLEDRNKREARTNRDPVSVT